MVDPRLRVPILVGVLAGAALLAAGGAVLAVNVVESATRTGIEQRLRAEGLSFATVSTDGLMVALAGTAQTEAMRFRALSVAGSVADPARVIDRIEVVEAAQIEPPRFAVEFLRNNDALSVIGLVPMATGRQPILRGLARAGITGAATDMLDSADYPVPSGWEAALDFALLALSELPQSKISVTSRQVRVAALSGSRADQRALEARLRAAAPAGVEVVLDISAPRPVVAPFTLRFVRDADGARFDACTADSEEARRRIVEAGVAAGASARAPCTIGLGVPSPDWAEAVEVALATVARLPAGNLTFSDTEVALVVPHDADTAGFEALAGQLRGDLPEGFSLTARQLEAPPVGDDAAPTVEFVTTLSPDGHLHLQGRLADAQMRDVVTSYANARFGAASVRVSTTLDEAMPDGWARRVLAGLEALTELDHGTLRVRDDWVELRGRSGNPDASDVVARILADRLGGDQDLRLAVIYDESLDPVASASTPQSCVADIAEILAERQITFAPGSADIDADSAATLDKIAAVLRDCGSLRLEIGGHTDSQGRAELNDALSLRRADAVREALLARRVLVGNFTTRGYGAARPVADNATAAGREANRRIEFLLRMEAPEGVETDPIGRFRDPEIEAQLVIAVDDADDEAPRPRARPGGD